MTPKKRRTLYIIEFNPKTRQVEAVASSYTKPLTDHEWNKVRKEKLNGLKNICWTERMIP